MTCRVALSQHLPWLVLDDVELGEVEEDVEVCANATLETPASIAAAARTVTLPITMLSSFIWLVAG